MPVVKFPRAYREPTPQPEQLELWADLPELPRRLSSKELLAHIADELDAAIAYLEGARVGIVLLQHDEDEQR